MTDPSNEITFEQFAMEATKEIKDLKAEVNSLKVQGRSLTDLMGDGVRDYPKF